MILACLSPTTASSSSSRSSKVVCKAATFSSHSDNIFSSSWIFSTWLNILVLGIALCKDYLYSTLSDTQCCVCVLPHLLLGLQLKESELIKTSCSISHVNWMAIPDLSRVIVIWNPVILHLRCLVFSVHVQQIKQLKLKDIEMWNSLQKKSHHIRAFQLLVVTCSSVVSNILSSFLATTLKEKTVNTSQTNQHQSPWKINHNL